MFCPNCMTEYIEGIRTCADCGVALVGTLPPVEEPVRVQADHVSPDSGRVAMAFCTDDSYDFINAAHALEEAGMPFNADEEYTGEFRAGKRVAAPYRWAIFVDETRLDEARSILSGNEAEFAAGQQMYGLDEGEENGEIADDAGRFIEQPETRKSCTIRKESQIVVAGDGPFRKFLLLVIVVAVIGAVMILLRRWGNM